MGRKLHLVDVTELVRSVLTATPVVAACGTKKVYTREGVELAVAGGLKVCADCMTATGADVAAGNEAHLHPAKGWTALLELAWRAEEAKKSRSSYSFTITSKPSRDWEFPLAA